MNRHPSDYYLWNQPDTTGMTSPVQCNRCGKVYDLGKVEVTARYADCTMFKTPCCNKEADDRPWVPQPAFRKLRRNPTREAT